MERPYRCARAALLLLSFFLMAGEVTLRDGFELGDSVEYANEAWRTVHGTAPCTWIARPKRPPLFRLLLCPPLAASLALHATPDARLAALRLAVAAMGAATVLATIALGRAAGGPRVGLVAGALLATNSLFVPLAADLYSEVPCALCLALAVLALLRSPRDRASLLAGLLIGAGVLFRFQALIFIPFVGLWVLVYRGVRAAAAHTAGLVLAVLALGVHDWLAAGRFLDSLWVMLGSDVADLTRDAASTWGASPWYDYALQCGRWLELTGPLALAIGAWRAWRDLHRPVFWALVAPAAGMLLVLTALAHKELRFMIPLLPLTSVLAALAVREGAVDRRVALAGALAVAVMPASGLVRLARAPQHLAYTGQRDLLRMLASERPDAVVLTPVWSVCLPSAPERATLVNFSPRRPVWEVPGAPKVTHAVLHETDVEKNGLGEELAKRGFRAVAGCEGYRLFAKD